MRIYSMPLQANTPVDIVVAGNFVRILSASADVQVSIDSREFLTLSQGLSVRPDGGYQRLRVLSATAQQVDIAAGFGSIDDSRLSVTAPVTVARGATLATAAASIGTAAALLLAASATRRSCFIFNNSTTAKLYVGASAAVTAANGWPIPPQGGLSLDQAPGAAVYAIASAAATDVRTLTESD